MNDHSEDGIGYLTWDEFERFRRAVVTTRRLIPWLRVAGYVRSGDPDELRHRSVDRPLGLPPTWLAAEEIAGLMQEINQWPELEDVAAQGSEFALHLTREVETADARWPTQDRPHKIQYLVCESCQQMTLKFYPPRGADEPINVKCTDRICGAVMDQVMFTRYAVMVEAENAERTNRGTGKRVGADQRSA